MGPGPGSGRLYRCCGVLVLRSGRERRRGSEIADSLSRDPATEAGCIPGSSAYSDAVVRVARALPGARPERLRIAGHSRGGGETLQYLLAIGGVQAAVLHSAGHGYRPVTRVGEFNVPMLILHGTADGPADGGGVNTQVSLAREFEAALRRNQKPVEAQYYTLTCNAPIITAKGALICKASSLVLLHSSIISDPPD
jgi:hypothetical protein